MPWCHRQKLPFSCIGRSSGTCAAALPDSFAPIREQISPRNPQIFCQNLKSSEESSSTIDRGKRIGWEECRWFNIRFWWMVTLAVDGGDGVGDDGDGGGVYRQLAWWQRVWSPLVWDLLISSWATGAAYKLPLSHRHHPPRHLGPFEASQKVFATLSLELELHLSSVSCQPPLLSSLTINYGVFPLDSVRLSAVFPDEGKTPPCPPHDLPSPGRQCSSRQNSCCSAEDRGSTIIFFLLSQAACSLVMWVGGL